MTTFTIHIAGDSTAAAKSSQARPESGWGEHLVEFFTDDVEINNQAKNGLSTKSFLESGQFQNLVEDFMPGDYLFIQFGHNDQKITTDRGTSPYSDYSDNLLFMIQTAIHNKVTPILLTPVTRCDFIGNKLNPYSLGAYPQAMTDLAQEYAITLLDLYGETQNLYQVVGEPIAKQFHLNLPPEEHVNYPDGIADNTHYNVAGANISAYLISDLLAKKNHKLAHYLNNRRHDYTAFC
jgi:lysophospholipase L1-like esterase